MASAYTVDANIETVVFPLPLGKSLVGCRWLYRIKVGSDGKIGRFKACLMANDKLIFLLDYSDHFSHMAKMVSVRLLLSLSHDIEMPFCLAILKRKCIWSNHLGLLLKESPLPWFVWFTGHFMVLNSLKQSARALYGKFNIIVRS